MPSELIRLPALCVSLAVDKDIVDGTKYGNTKKNINRVYNILNAAEKLYVSLNEGKEATFFDNEIRIHFKLSKKKEKLITGFNLDTIEEDEEAEMDESPEILQEEAVVEEEVHSSFQENLVIDDLECLKEPETKSSNSIEPCSDSGQGQALSQSGEQLMLSEPIESIQEDCVEVNEDKDLLDGNSKRLDVRKDENHNDTSTVHDKVVEMSPKLMKMKSLLIEEAIETSEVDSAYQSNPTSPKLGGEEEASSNDSSQVPSVSKDKSTCEEVPSRKGNESQPRHSLPASLRFKSSVKLNSRRDKRKQKQLNGWSVGDPVIAMWTLDGVWRRGNIHEMDRGHAFVIASEEAGVKATRVLIQDLKPANMPMELLNCVEEELLGWSRGDGKL